MRERRDQFEEDLTALIDGQTTDFPTTYKFWPGSTTLLLNGIDQGLPNAPGSVFSEPDDQTVHMDSPIPRPGMTLVVQYRPQ